MKKLISFGVFLILLSGVFIACKKDKGDPPVLPPKESMTIDFSNFEITGKSAGTKGTENSNYEFAATVASIWKVIVNTTLIVPVYSFQMAVGKTPVYVSQNNWEWSYNVTSGGATYKARLTGVISGTVVNWKMYITKEGTGGFPEFVWFEGTSKVDGTGGQWILNQSAAAPTPLLQIDWTKSATAGNSIIKYKYVKNDAFANSSIEYGLTEPTIAYYTVSYWNGAKLSSVNVEWNTASHNGRVKCLDYLGTTDWYCWDANKINTICN